MENDLQYYSRRAAEERLAAERADSPQARRCHRELAEHYALIVREKETIPAEAALSAVPAD